MTVEKLAIVSAGRSAMGADAAQRLKTRLKTNGFLVGHAEEVSSLISRLVPEYGGYMTGQNLRIDGCLTRAV